MRPLRVEVWGLGPRHLLAGLAILLAAAVLSLVLFPAGHGSFVSTHGPATAFRSRRFFLAVRSWLVALVGMLAGLFCLALPCSRSFTFGRRQTRFRNLNGIFPFPAVLLC